MHSVSWLPNSSGLSCFGVQPGSLTLTRATNRLCYLTLLHFCRAVVNVHHLDAGSQSDQALPGSAWHRMGTGFGKQRFQPLPFIDCCLLVMDCNGLNRLATRTHRWAPPDVDRPKIDATQISNSSSQTPRKWARQSETDVSRRTDNVLIIF